MKINSINEAGVLIDQQNPMASISQILSFSSAIASASDKNVLARILQQQLNKLLQIDDYIIYALNDEKKTYQAVLYDCNGEFAQHPSFQKLIGSETAINNRLFTAISCSSGPYTFDADVWFRIYETEPTTEYSTLTNLTQITGAPIIMGEDCIAIMIFKQRNPDQIAFEKQLFKNICSQLALLVFGIVAKERASRHLIEIERYRQQLNDERMHLREGIAVTQNPSEIIGNSSEMRHIFQQVAQVASSDSTVLLLGETGTGKELIARAIHNASPRKDSMMVKVNCAALPANLIESELFGHERGSFTGAVDRRIGKFELANNGTLFLDEIGEMPLDLQVKLLRALQEREIERVGGRNTIKVNVRIIAATNRDLETEMKAGRFRMDLYYRLNIFPISLPPLRERKQDIPALASYFIDRFAKKAGKKINTLSNRAFQELIDYPWPGNIRELEHLIERSVLLSTGDSIKQIHLPVQKQHTVMLSSDSEIVIKTIDENERDHIFNILKYCKGRISGKGGAADLLGIPASTLNSKVKKLGIKREHSKQE